MNFIITRLRSFARNEEAQDLIEYALLVGLISLVAVAAIGRGWRIGQHDLRQHRRQARVGGQHHNCRFSPASRLPCRRGAGADSLRKVRRNGAVIARMDAVVALVHKLVLRRDEGQDLIEYGLLVALIAIVAMVAVGTVGTTVRTMFWDTFQAAIASAV